MSSIFQTIWMWHNQAFVLLATVGGVMLFHYATKVWSAPVDAVLAAILGASIGAAGTVLFLTRHIWGISLGPKASWFIILYLWCILVMLFLASRDTPAMKLFLGLVSQAGILYALFLFV